MTGAPLQLGDLLGFSRRSSRELSAWLATADAALEARLAQEAVSRQETVAQFVRIAVADFLALADEEAWASLLSAIRAAPDPGAACLGKMAAFRLQREAPA
ncbi:MAG: hypothetical protein AB7T59_04495 [Hyphomonadaceae bacterium]